MIIFQFCKSDNILLYSVFVYKFSKFSNLLQKILKDNWTLHWQIYLGDNRTNTINPQEDKRTRGGRGVILKENAIGFFNLIKSYLKVKGGESILYFRINTIGWIFF